MTEFLKMYLVMKAPFSETGKHSRINKMSFILINYAALCQWLSSVQLLSMKSPYISIELCAIGVAAKGAGGGGLKSADCRSARGLPTSMDSKNKRMRKTEKEAGIALTLGDSSCYTTPATPPLRRGSGSHACTCHTITQSSWKISLSGIALQKFLMFLPR